MQSAEPFVVPWLYASSFAVLFPISLFHIYLTSVSDHLPQFPFLCKFAAQYAKVVDQVFAGLHESGTRSECTISLDAEYKLAMWPANISENPPREDRSDLLTYLTSGWGTL